MMRGQKPGSRFLIAVHLVALWQLPVYAQDHAVVARHTVYPGTLIDRDSIKTVDASYCPDCDAGYFNEIDKVAGKIAVRTLVPGKLIFPQDIRSAPAVIRGQEVVVVFDNGPLRISMLGVPLADAAEGETVAVRNPKNGAIVSGMVGQDGVVKVMQ